MFSGLLHGLGLLFMEEKSRQHGFISAELSIWTRTVWISDWAGYQVQQEQCVGLPEQGGVWFHSSRISQMNINKE